METQLQDARAAKRAWHRLGELLQDPKKIADAARASHLEDMYGFAYPSLRIEGGQLSPELAGFFVHISPLEEIVFTDRFLDLDKEGERVHPDRELQVPVDASRQPANLPRFDIAWRKAVTPEQLGDIIPAYGIAQDEISDVFMHEFLHALQAERSGPEATQAGFKGPKHPTTQRRLKARSARSAGWDPKHAYAGLVDRSPQSSESYAALDRFVTQGLRYLEQYPDVSLNDFILKLIGGLPRSYKKPQLQRITRMLSKMWHEHRAPWSVGNPQGSR